MSNFTRCAVVVLLALGLVFCSGCFRMSMEIAAAPDGSTSARILAGVQASLTQDKETKNPFADMTKGGANWKSREYRDGDWLMTEATGSAPAGKSLFPADDKEAPQVKLVASPRRLSTEYAMTLQVPPSAQEISKTPTDMDEQTQALVKGMLGGFQISFSLAAPGRVVATSGKVVAPGKAEWKLGMDDLNAKKLPEFRLVTELTNWSNLGKLGDQLAYTGRLYEATPKLAAALQRDLLPNPRANASDGLQPEDYARLLEIIDKLDSSLKPSLTDSIIARTGLNSDIVSPASIQKAHERVMKADFGALVGKAALAGAIEIVHGK